MRIEESLEVTVAPESLWPWISAPERLARWIPDVERFEARPAGELADGSRLIAHLPRGAAPLEARVERAEPGRALVLRASGLPNDLEVLLTFLLAEQGGGSTLTVRAETQLKGLMAFAEEMIATKARAKLRSWTDRLRALVASA